MKLILTAAVENLGAPGEIVEVKNGYGRNYLLPRGLAIVATRGAEKQIEGIKRAQEARAIRDLDHAREVRNQLEQLSGVQVAMKTSENGKLFGSVSADDIVSAVEAAGGRSWTSASSFCLRAWSRRPATTRSSSSCMLTFSAR